MKKRLIYIAAIIAAGGILFSQIFTKIYPKHINLETFKLDKSAEAIQRGEYLANHVAACVDCHTPKNGSKDSLFAGSNSEFTSQYGFPGNYYAANLTPYKLKNWSDAEIFRAITSGISKDGHALFPVMPYGNYGQLEKKDIYDIIAYLRSLPEVKKDVPVSESNFPMNFIIRTIPKEGSFALNKNISNSIARGKYLVTMAACADCHTKTEKGKPIEGFEFAGGNEYISSHGKFVSANITPDKETGIGNWTKESFVARFKNHTLSNDPNKISIMPWQAYSKMNEDDLTAIYNYLMSLLPVKNKIQITLTF